MLPAAPMPPRRRCRPRSASTADDRIEDVEREIVDGPHLPRSRWEDIAAVLDTGSKADQDQAARLREALAFSGVAQVDEYLDVFLTDADARPRKSVVTKKFVRRQSGDRPPVRVGRRPPRAPDRAAPRA